MIQGNTQWIQASPGSVTSARTCPICGKYFSLNTDVWRFKSRETPPKFFCSYHCQKEFLRVQMENDREKTRCGKDQITGKNKKQTLQEWADEYGIEYEKLWEKCIINKIYIMDAIALIKN